MRPVRLELEGFTAFRDRTEVDLAGAELFVLCGPTGAGKSSLIDAICFALYGSVPRYNDPSLVHPVISQGKNEARVRFDFTVAGTPYTAVRVVRRTKTGATTREARLESRGEVLAGAVRELDERVRAIFGLSFEQFTTCVVIPQGEFARFLHDPPAARQELLRELLGLSFYDRMGTLASRREADAQRRAGHVAGQLAQLDGATPAARRELGRRLRALQRLVKAADKAQVELDGLDRRAREYRDGAERHEANAKVLAGVAVPRDVARVDKELSVAVAARARARAALEAAERTHDAAEQARRKLPAPEPLREQLAAHGERERKAEEVAAAEVREKKTRSAHERARSAVEETRAAVAAALARREEVMCANAAHHLASTLDAGDACPVCRRPVERKPRHAKPPGLDPAQRAFDAAEKALRAAESAAADALRAHTTDATRLATLREFLGKLDASLRGAPARDKIAAQLETTARVDAHLEQALAARVAGQQAERAARRALEALEGRVAEAWKEFDAARERVAALKPPAPDRTDLAGSWKKLAAWAGEAVSTERAAAAEGRAVAGEADAARETRLAELERSCRENEVEPGVQHPRDALIHAAATAEQRLASVERDIARTVTLEAELATARSEQVVAHTLAQHLSAKGLERWLLQAAFDRLVTAASERLRALSNGDYSFRIDDRSSFEIVDHRNADEVRPARTLSGGETFLASLALALSLADQVAELATEGAAPLDSMFLDEGFGTLDAETLDVVATTIEELGARGRTIGIVTHVRDLADRVPVQYRITRGPTGSAVERVAS